MKPPYAVLITGASAGLGAEFVRQIAPDAESIVLVARRVERLYEMQAQLNSRFPSLKIHIAPADLSKTDDVDGLVRWLEKNNIKVNYLINNAGFGDIGTFDTSDWNKIRDMLRVNIEALTALTHALLPDMLAQKRGVILNVASTAGMLPLPTFAVYAATKAYVCSFSEALRIEVKDRGVTVTALCPGPVETEFGEVAKRSNASRSFAPPTFLFVTPEKVVRDALAGARRGRARVIPGLLVRLAMLFIEIVPVPVLRLFMGSSARLIDTKS